MQVADLERLYTYHYWANDRLLSAVKRLSAEEFTRAVAGSYGSVRNTLVHVMSAEWGWLDRCGGPTRGARLNAADYPTIEIVLETWKRVEGYLRGFLTGLTDEDLARNVEFSFGNGPQHSVSVGELLQHGAVHAVHHRGQVAMLLRMLGHTPGDFDLLYFASENPRCSEP